MKKAQRLENLPPYPFARWSAEVAAVRQQGQDVIRLDIGNPDMAPPKTVIDKLCRSARDADHHGYAGYRGLPSLRQAIAGYYARRFDVDLNPNTQIVPLIGSKEGIVNMALATLDPGDVALVPDPGYAPYTMGTLLAGGEVYTLPLDAERAFRPDLTGIPAGVLDRAKVMWLNYPNNPTGAVADLAFLTEVVDFVRRHDLLLCYDAPYTDVTYGDYTAPSVLQVEGAMEVAVEFNSLSKTFNMAGWRLGMAVGQEKALGALAQVKSNVDSGMFHPLQEAAVAALSVEPSWIAERNRLYQTRLDLIVRGLRDAGIDAEMPDAALYVWAAVPAERGAAETFARALLTETGVAVAPGPFFGASGEGYIRVSATAPTDRVREAMQRLRSYVG
jgi:LL-diaminopimelate aminotransferase